MSGRRYWYPQLEQLDRKELLAVQWVKLRSQLEHLWATNPFHRDRLRAAGVSSPDEINSLDAFRDVVPFSVKADHIADQDAVPPYGTRLGVQVSQLATHCLTAGTSGRGQEVYGFTRLDLELTASDTAQLFHWAGLRPGHRLLGLTPVGYNLAGWATIFASEKAGLACYMVDPLTSPARIAFMRRFTPDAFFLTTPSHLTRLSVLAKEADLVPIRDLPSLTAVLISGENFPIPWAQAMEEFWGCQVKETYGAMPYGFTSAVCEEPVYRSDTERGCMHLGEHTVLVEVLKPGTNEHVDPGERGEIVVTQLHREASPVLRYRSADSAVYLGADACPCGRPSAAIESGTIGRYDDMMKIRANNIWPMTVDDVVLSHPAVAEYRGRVYLNDKGKDDVVITVALQPECRTRSEAERGAVLAELVRRLKEQTNLTVRIEEVPELPEFEYKARRWTDDRQATMADLATRKM
jgi:phenylacetate-CoA ligase